VVMLSGKYICSSQILPNLLCFLIVADDADEGDDNEDGGNDDDDNDAGEDDGKDDGDSDVLLTGVLKKGHS